MHPMCRTSNVSPPAWYRDSTDLDLTTPLQEPYVPALLQRRANSRRTY